MNPIMLLLAAGLLCDTFSFSTILLPVVDGPLERKTALIWMHPDRERGIVRESAHSLGNCSSLEWMGSTVIGSMEQAIVQNDAQGGKPSPHPPGEVTIEILPLRNELRVMIDGKLYKKYKIALGKPQTPTPAGDWKVINKYTNWGSGFGTRWIGLNVPWGIYGIHGTNRPSSIGQDASHGCIRMRNHQVEELFEWVKVGTTVSILGHALGEPHRNPRDLARGDSGADVQLIQSRLRSAGYYEGPCDGKFRASTEQAMKAYEKAHGLPVDGVVNQHDYMAMGLLE